MAREYESRVWRAFGKAWEGLRREYVFLTYILNLGRRCCAAAGEEGQGRDESLCPDGNGWERRKGGRMCHYEMVGVG